MVDKELRTLKYVAREEDRKAFIDVWGKEFLGELTQVAIIKSVNAILSTSIHGEEQKRIEAMMLDKKAITRNTKYVYARITKFSAPFNYVRLSITNGNGNTILSMDITPDLKREIFEEEVVV